MKINFIELSALQENRAFPKRISNKKKLQILLKIEER